MKRIEFTDEQRATIDRLNKQAAKFKSNKAAMSNFMANLSPQERELLSQWVCMRLVGYA